MSADVRAAEWVRANAPAQYAGPLRSVFWWLGHFGVTLGIAAAITALHRLRWRAGLLVVASGAAAGPLYGLVTWAVGRTRPFKGVGAFELSPFHAGLSGLVHHQKNAAFPSGHAVLAFATAAALAFLLPRWRVAFFLLAAGVAVFRVLTGAHYPSDVVAGAALGVLGYRIARVALAEKVLSPAPATAPRPLLASPDGPSLKVPRSRIERHALAIVAGALLLLIPLTAAFLVQARAGVVSPTHSVGAGERQVNLLAIGDWGADTTAEAAVAGAMAAYADRGARPVDAVLLAGDNFYMPLSGVGDPIWTRLFERMFDEKRLAVPFYACLGNHDYQKGKDQIELEYARRNPTTRWKMPARWYRVELPADRPLVTVLMLDSNRGDLNARDWKEENRWLEAELVRPRTTRWMVVVAHHPLFSNGSHGDDRALQEQWGQLFERHDVDFYVSGHDHDLQHLSVPGHSTAFLLCGGGGANTRRLKRSARERGPFAERLHGFLHLRFGERSADVSLLDEHARPVHAFAVKPRRSAEAEPGAGPRAGDGVGNKDAGAAGPPERVGGTNK